MCLYAQRRVMIGLSVFPVDQLTVYVYKTLLHYYRDYEADVDLRVTKEK